MKHRAKSKSMAEIVAEVEEEKALDPGADSIEYPVDGRWLEVEGRIFTVSEEEITPEEARDLAQSSGLVIWDSCGCGGGCGYEIWKGSEISDLVAAGVPKVKEGAASRIQDGNGHFGVLLERAVRWGPLR